MRNQGMVPQPSADVVDAGSDVAVVSPGEVDSTDASADSENTEIQKDGESAARNVAIQLADGWIYPGYVLAAVRVNKQAGRWNVEVRLSGDSPLDPPRLRAVYSDAEAAQQDAISLSRLLGEDIKFAPQAPEEPVLDTPREPDVRPAHRFEGQNMGTFSGWQEEALIHPGQLAPSHGAGYGTGPVAARRASLGVGDAHPFASRPEARYLEHPILTRPPSATVPHPTINNEVLAEIDAMGGAPGWMGHR